mgnify:CR=1 FL=1
MARTALKPMPPWLTGVLTEPLFWRSSATLKPPSLLIKVVASLSS